MQVSWLLRWVATHHGSAQGRAAAAAAKQEQQAAKQEAVNVK